jgi:hypothetical protein
LVGEVDCDVPRTNLGQALTAVHETDEARMKPQVSGIRNELLNNPF